MTTPTPSNEAIEAAAAAICLLDYAVQWERMGEAGRKPCRNLATAALTAAYPLIVAQAKAEALREAAENFPAELPEFAYTRPDGLIDYIDVQGWLKAQAHQELGPTHCQICGIDLQYPTARHIIDCPTDVTS